MFDWNNFEKHRNIFAQVGLKNYSEKLNQHHVDLRPSDLIRWIEFCKTDLDYLTLVDVTAAHRSELPSKWGYELEVVYLLFSMESHQRLNLHVHLNQNEVLPSIVSHFPYASWMEREQSEMFGIRFNQEHANLLLPHGTTFYPLRKAAAFHKWPAEPDWKLPRLRVNPNKTEAPYPEEAWVWKEYGLLDKETMGNFEWQLCFDPVRVVDSRAKIGFHHRGLEKLYESKNWLHVMQLVDLINPGVAPTYSIAWAKNLEDILRIKLPERAQAIRIVMLELARVAEHLSILHEIALCLKKEEHRLFLNAREKVYELFEKYCGHRQGRGMVRLGGVREDLPHGWVIEYQSMSNVLLKTLRLVHKSLISQHDFRPHLDHSGVNAQTVLEWGIGGPAMRASGLNFDLRKSQPLYFYQDIDFDIPVGIHGTSFDRYLIRYEEIHQSLRIITQVLDNLPLGEVINPLFLEEQGTVLNYLEDVTPGWHYSSLEAPNGEAGFFHLHSRGPNPYRLKIKTPSFTLSQGLPAFIQGSEEWQLPSTLASLGIEKSEQDR